MLIGAASPCSNLMAYQLHIVQQNEPTKMVQHNAKSLIEKFIYSCSHDLRGPVATIQGLVRLAEEHPQHVDSNNCIKMIGECSEKLDHIIHSLQEYMEIESHTLEMAEIDLPEFIENVTEEFYPELIEKQILIESEVEGVRCKTDSYHLGKVLNKVISNAIHFRDPGKRSKIRIEATRWKHDLLLYVKDNGLGIPDHLRANVFDVFFKAHDISKSAGMGLFLARQLVDRLQGSIDLQSQVGIGTTVTIRLPRTSQ